MADDVKEKLNLLNDLAYESEDRAAQLIAEHLSKLREELDYKDQLLANLYTTNDFLKKELEEKNYVIRKLLQKDDPCKRKSFSPQFPQRSSDEDPNSSCNGAKTLNNLSFNSEYLTFNEDSLDDSNKSNNRGMVYHTANEETPASLPTIEMTSFSAGQTSGYDRRRTPFNWSSSGEETSTGTDKTIATGSEIGVSGDGVIRGHFLHPPTRSYLPVDRQLDDYRKVQGENFRVLRRNFGGNGSRLYC